MDVFRLSIISDEVSQDFERVASFASRTGLEAVEIRTVWNLKPQELLSKIGEMRKILKKYGLKVSAIASPFFKSELDSEEEYREHIEILKRCIELAKSLDTDIIRGFAFWRKGDLRDFEERIIEKFREPLDIVEREGVILAIENEPSTFVGNGEELGYFVRRLGSDNVKALWDPGNDIWDPKGEIPYPDGYNHVRDILIHVHVKDGVRTGPGGKGENTPIGEGEVDYHGQLLALIQDRYKGYLSVETHWRPKKRLSEEEIVKPGGAAFSEFGEEASEICVRNLLEIIEKVKAEVCGRR